MENLLSNLPDPNSLTDMVSADGGLLSPETFGIEGLQDVQVGDLVNNLSNVEGGDTPSVEVPTLPEELSPDGSLELVKAPLNQLKAIDGDSLLGNLGQEAGIDIDTGALDFDINELVGNIVNKILPADAPSDGSFDSLPSIPGLDVSDFNVALSEVARASANAPLKVLSALLAVIEKFVATISDVEILQQVSEEAMIGAVEHQVEALLDQLPLGGVNRLISLFDGSDPEAQLLASIETIFNRIQATDLSDPREALRLAEMINSQVVPQLDRLREAKQMLISIRGTDLTVLTEQLEKLLGIVGAQEALLGPVVTEVNGRVTALFSKVRGPIVALAENAKKIEVFINDTADKAQQGAEAIAGQVTSRVEQVNKFIVQAELEIRRIEDKIVEFISSIDISTTVDAGKAVCTNISDGIESFFTRVEEVKIKLNAAVDTMAQRLENQVPEAFTKLETQIRKLLRQITDQLERPEFQEALDKARAGIDTFKSKIDEASLQPVFDIVVEKTSDLETKVSGIDVSTLGVPQKTALKVGSRILEKVKVDEVVKPELIDAFRQIQGPLQDLLRLLEEKFLVIEERINSFNPGTIVNDLIINSEPYQALIQLLEHDLKPTQLLQPLKDAYQDLLALAEKVNPDQLIDEVQKVYLKLTGLLDSLAFEPLNRLITDATQTVNFQLQDVRDNQLPRVATSIQESISLQNLLAGTGFEDIGDLPLWDTLVKVLSGGYLDEVTAAMEQAEERLGNNLDRLNVESIAPLLNRITTELNRQLRGSADLVSEKLEALQAQLSASAAQRESLVTQYQSILSDAAVSSDLTRALEKLDINLVDELAADLDATITHFAAIGDSSADGAVTLENQLVAINQKIVTEVEKASNSIWSVTDDVISIDLSEVNSLLLGIFHQQLTQPVDDVVKNLKEALQPFGDAVIAIQGVVKAVTAVPQTIDQAVATVIDSLVVNVQSVLSETINGINVFESALISIIDQIHAKVKALLDGLSPYWLLNYFVAKDFYDSSQPQITIGVQTKTTTTVATEESLAQVFFEPDKDEVLEAQQSAFREALDSLEGKPVVALVIEGYTKVTTDSDYNLLLSERRARNVREFFEELANTDYQDQLQEMEVSLAYYDKSQWGQNGTVTSNPSQRRVDLKLTCRATTAVTTNTNTEPLLEADVRGLLALGIALIKPGDDPLAHLIADSYLSANQREVLQSYIFSGTDGSTRPLGTHQCRILLDVFNSALKNERLCSEKHFNYVQNKLSDSISTLLADTAEVPVTDEEKAQRTIDINHLYRKQALFDQLIVAKTDREANADKTFTTIRLNRVLLEAHYLDHIKMSIQSLFPFILKQLAGLYPEQALKRLDRLHGTLVAEIKTLPERLIKAPLDEEFERVRSILIDNFDVRGIFTSLNVKLEGLDDDLVLGLDRLGVSYRQLITTFNQKVA